MTWGGGGLDIYMIYVRDVRFRDRSSRACSINELVLGDGDGSVERPNNPKRNRIASPHPQYFTPCGICSASTTTKPGSSAGPPSSGIRSEASDPTFVIVTVQAGSSKTSEREASPEKSAIQYEPVCTCTR